MENWRGDSTIKELFLSCNFISRDGAQQLLSEAANHGAIESIELSGNKRIGFAGLYALVNEEIPTLKLRKLTLWNCAFADADD